MSPVFKIGGAVLLTALLPTSVFAGERIGALECHLSGNGPSILVENQSVDCVFAGERGGSAAHYIGKLSKVGANIGANGGGDLLWDVVAETSKIGGGALAGEYVGPETSVKLGAGLGAAALVGGSNQTFSLQPLNVEGGAGLGFTAGVESLTLVYVPNRPAPKMRNRHFNDAHQG